jgi:glycolate oxidase FAD binding subunit
MLGKCGVAETLLLDNEAAATALQQTIDAYIEPRGARSITYRHAGPPATVWQRVRSTTDALREIGARCDTIADLRTGDAIVRTTGPSIIATDTTLRAALPTATLLAGDPDLRLRLDAWGAAPATLATQTALKERFDPGRNLAPGRYIGGL